MQKFMKLLMILIFFTLCASPVFARDMPEDHHPIQAMVGELLTYDISFLWFDRLAVGTIELSHGEQPGTFLIVMKAKTLGVAAFFSSNRVEKYQTLMEIGPAGLLQPLWHSSHTIRGDGDTRTEKITRYSFDYAAGQVHYQKIKNGHAYSDQLYPMEKDKPLFDILFALYNLRLGFFGSLTQERIFIPTFHRKGTQDIVVEPLQKANKKDRAFFAKDPIQCRILVDPSVFGTKGRDILASFDGKMRPHRGIIKNVIGLGDVRGELRVFH